MSTKNKLIEALKAVGAPGTMIQRAERGLYDDYESPLATPIRALVLDAQTAGLEDIAQRAMNGEFDSTQEEGEAWLKKEGYDLLLEDKDNGN